MYIHDVIGDLRADIAKLRNSIRTMEFDLVHLASKLDCPHVMVSRETTQEMKGDNGNGVQETIFDAIRRETSPPPAAGMGEVSVDQPEPADAQHRAATKPNRRPRGSARK